MSEFQILSHRPIAKNTYELMLEGETRGMTTPGQFVTLRLPGFFLRRPISVAEFDARHLRLIYKVVGHGTEYLAGRTHGKIEVMTGIGNGYDLSLAAGKTPVLIGGGSGIPPLYGLAKKFLETGVRPIVILGFNAEDEIFLADEFETLGADVRIATADGSVGTKGFVTTVLERVAEEAEGELYCYSCGPMPMFHAIVEVMKRFDLDGSFSMEERMGCAVGICLGCAIETKEGMKRVCKDGPVFRKEDLPWA